MTKINKKLKTVFSLLTVVIILSSIITVPVNAAYSPFVQRSRAFVASALAALNIVTQSATMDTASIIEYIADPMEVQYTHMDAWQDRPEIQIYPDYTVIDGREYTDIWISNEAAEKFRIDAFDFKTAYQIASQSNGSFYQGSGTIDGAPYYKDNNNYFLTQKYSVSDPGTYSLGNGTVTYNGSGDPLTGKLTSWRLSNSYNTGADGHNLQYPQYYYLRSAYQNDTNRFYLYTGKNGTDWQAGSVYASTLGNLLDNTPFSYDYVAGEIPADQPLPADTGMMLRLPSDDGLGNRYFDNWLVDNPEFDQGQPVTIDINLDPNIETKLDDLLDIIIPIMPIINNNVGDIQFIENHDTPAPVPDSLLPDTYWSQLETKLDQIRQTIQNLTPDFSQIIQSIQTIPSAITQAVSNITQAISNLSDQILKDIEEGPIRLLDKLIDVLRNLFFPILATLRGFLGIWHYVVTWMSNISAPFTWTMNIMAGTSPVLVSPIYALIAGIIVIAVYRRFGR